MTNLEKILKMIDTVILTIPWGSYIIDEPDKFNPSAKGLKENPYDSFGSRFFTTYVQNPTAEDYKLGIYKPRLTITRRATRKGIVIPLKIEFSAPKMVFSNNIDELEEKDFDPIVSQLQQRLKEMGISIFTAILKNAPVSGADFAKNIPLFNYYTASYAIKQLGKTDISKKLDLNKTHFRNEGHALYFYAKSYSVVLYDKLFDIALPKGRTVDNDKTTYQLHLFDDCQRTPEILRIEIRLRLKQKLNSTLKTLGYKPNPTFKEVFSQSLAQKVIRHYWNLFFPEKFRFLFSFEEESDKILRRIITWHKDKKLRLSATNALALLGMVIFTKKHGIKALRQIIDSNYSGRTWFRIKNHLDRINLATEKEGLSDFVKNIENILEEFKPFKFDLLNKVK